MNRDYYKILIVAGSGKGKTYSARNLDPKTTGFLNIENKPLPFRNQFLYHERPKSSKETAQAFKAMAENPQITSIFVDSLSAYLEMLLREARATKSGYEIWNQYNERVGLFFSYMNSIDKEIFITAHYEVLVDPDEGVAEKRVKTKGKEWEGTIEREFTAAVYAYTKDSGDPSKRPTHYFSLVSHGDSAKFPPAIFGEEVLTIPNDCQLILEKVWEFVGESK